MCFEYAEYEGKDEKFLESQMEFLKEAQKVIVKEMN